MQTQICLLSGELMPNLIGILHQRPDVVAPIVTAQTDHQVAALQRALDAAGARLRFAEPRRVNAYDLADCRATLRQAAAGEGEFTFNWTGGTKIMSYAARRVAEESKAKALYVLGNSREVLVEDLATGEFRTDVTDAARLNLNIMAHLLAAGHTVEGANTPDQFRARYSPAPPLVDAAVAIMDAHPKERRDLYALANAREKAVKPLNLNAHFINLLRAAKLVQNGRQPGELLLGYETLIPASHLESPQEANARFLAASYLEVFIWDQVKQRSGLDEVGWSVRLNPFREGRSLELDLAIAGEGRFLIGETKTRVELDALTDLLEEQYARCRRIGGPFARWMLYVHQFRGEFGGGAADQRIASAVQRALDYGGKLLWHDDLADLPNIVITMLDERKPVL